MVDLPLEEVFENATAAKKYVPVPVFPEAKRDLALTVPLETRLQDLVQAMRQAGTGLREAEWFDTYRGQGVPSDKKSVAFHLTFAHPYRTLASSEVDEAMQAMEKKLHKEFGAEMRRS